MKIAIISDIHENFHNLGLFFKEAKKCKIEKIYFLGDFINGGVAKVMADFDIPTFAIWGNNDGDKVTITKTAMKDKSNLEVGFETFDTQEIDGRKIFLTHYPLLAKPMAKSGDFDAVFYGHNHQKNMETIGNCLVLNPGEISAHKTGEASFAVYDTKTNKAEIITLKDTVTTKSKESEELINKVGFKFGKSKSHQY